MQVTARSRLKMRVQDSVFVVLFLSAISLLAWLSTRYVYQADWTAGSRNTLSQASITLLKRLDAPITVSAYAREDAVLRRQISNVVERYQRHKPDIELSFVNPDTAPERVRELGISVDGTLVISYRGRTEKLDRPSEQEITNALQHLARSGERWVIFLEGHGERSPFGQANHDLGNFVRELTHKGLKVEAVNLAKNPSLPDNTSVLIIASPQVDLLPGEVKIVADYVEQGGNLLWLEDPGELHGLDALAERLTLKFAPGVVVDATTQLFGIEDPAFALVADYKAHPVTMDLQAVTLFPRAAALDWGSPDGWQAEALLTTLPRSWSETGPISGEIQRDPDSGERAGPLNIAVSLTRARAAARDAPAGSQSPASDSSIETQASKPRQGEQRIIVTGDGDFLANTYLGNGGNLDLGINMIEWLSHDDNLISIRAKSAPDLNLNLSPVAAVCIGFGFLLVLPLTLLGAGLTLWLRRRRL
jgi:ABC-type uncharacterized transport system involved in gliding motility, auxiliary component